MRQVAARRHHNKQRAEGFIPNQNGQDNNNDNGNSPNGNNGSSSSAAPTTTTTQASSPAPSRTVAATTTTTTTPPAAQTTTTTTTTTTPASSSSTTTTTTLAIVTTTTPTPIVVQQPTTSINQIPTTASVPITRSVANPTIGTASFSSDSAGPSVTAAASSSGPQIGPLVGAIGGGLIGVIALAAIAGYFFRRAFRKKDEFNRSEFVRNSVAINDNWDEKPPMGSQNAMALARANNNMDEPSATPRPPSMLERRGPAQPAYGVGEVVNNGYYGQQDQYYNNYGNNGYYGHDQYAAGYDQQYAAGGHPYVAGAAYGYTPPNEYQQSQLTRKPSAPLGAARGPGSEYEQQQQQQQQGHEHVASPVDGSQYDTRHQSVTPFQQQQYNEINKALNGGLTPVNETPAGGRELSTAYSTLNQPQQPAQGQQQHGTPAAASAHQPAANNRKSLYDEEDAYGGI